MSPLSWASSYSTSDNFYLRLVPCWKKGLYAMTLIVEQSYTLLWLKQQLLVWNQWTPKLARRYYTVYSHTCSRSEYLCTHWPPELYTWRRSSTSGMQYRFCLGFWRWKRGTSPWQYPNTELKPSAILSGEVYFTKNIQEPMSHCFKILFQSKFSTTSNEKPRIFLKNS